MAGKTGRRWVFLASERPEDFGFLDDLYVRTENLEHAEFVVYDLSHPPKTVELGKQVMFYGHCPVPLLAVAFDEESLSESELEKLRFARGGVQPDVYFDAEEFKSAIQHLESVLPFYNARRLVAETGREEGLKAYTSLFGALTLQSMRSPESAPE